MKIVIILVSYSLCIYLLSFIGLAPLTYTCTYNVFFIYVNIYFFIYIYYSYFIKLNMDIKCSQILSQIH